MSGASAPQVLVDELPSFRRLGVIARVLVLVNLALLLATLFAAQGVSQLLPVLLGMAAVVEPVLIACLAALFLSDTWLSSLRYEQGVVAVCLLVAALTAVVYLGSEFLLGKPHFFGLLRAVLFGMLAAIVLAEYFRLRNRSLSPAFAEARLQALQARIRPHFLFNSLNAVLSLIRSDPRRAEVAIEDLADMFRTLMADNRKLVALSDEIRLVREYLNIEELRLGGRLVVRWLIEGAPKHAQVPPLFLQPLVENAVYHGVEPGRGPGTVEIEIRRTRDRLRFRLSNPYHPEHQHRQGNRMALANIRERLALHFDVEAKLESGALGNRYEIRIELPYRRAQHEHDQ